MSAAVYGFVFNGEVSNDKEWKISDEDMWDLDLADLSGQEKVLGHRKIDGAIVKVVRLNNGKLFAITK